MDATLGNRELDVMGALWADGPGTVAEVRERLPVALAYNTVLTILRNLEAKGFVDHSAAGRTHCYRPVVAEEEVRGNALSRLVDRLFGGSGLRLVADLVDQRALSVDDLRRLQRFLDARLAGDKSAGNTLTGPINERVASSKSSASKRNGRKRQ